MSPGPMTDPVSHTQKYQGGLYINNDTSVVPGLYKHHPSNTTLPLNTHRHTETHTEINWKETEYGAQKLNEGR